MRKWQLRSSPIIRPTNASELPALSDLCLRSKAFWGYDAAFIAACKDELTLTAGDLATSHVVVAENDGVMIGVAQLTADGQDAELDKLYVDPDHLGQGIGRALFDWAIETTRGTGARRMTIDADPHAQAIYERMGAYLIGTSPSGSIPGRMLPQLAYDL
jgi:GNAT superfamily N-acetyltransferase